MSTVARELRASINGTPVGTLRESGGLWSFRYADAWRADPRAFALSPQLPLAADPLLDGASERPVQWYFDNLLPEEGQRSLLARDARIDAADAFALLAWYGAESAGSLTLLAGDANEEAASGLRPLQEADLAERIRALPRLPLSHGAVKRMSLAGAQHKLAVVVDGEALFEPVGAQASTHILKPDHPEADYPHSVANEWFVMRLAARVGLAVPAVRRRYVPAPVYLVERFDRVRSAQGWQRRHAIDACQLLGLDRLFKYREGSIARLAQLAAACRSPAVARTRLFEWLAFNVLTGNSDAHLKNLSFLVSHEGIQPAPFYDLLSVASYESLALDRNGWPQQTTLAWPILGAERFAEVDGPLLLEAGAAMGLARPTAARLLARLRERTVREAGALLADVVSENAALAATRPALGHGLAGEERLLRVVVHGVIADMAARLA